MTGGFNHNQDESADQTRMLLAVALSAAILGIWGILVPQQAPVQPIEPQQTSQVAPATDSAPSEKPTHSGQADVAPPIEARQVATLKAPGSAELALSNIDGALLSWRLEESQYRTRNEAGEPADPYDLIGTLKANSTEGIFLSPRLELMLNGQLARGDYRAEASDKSDQAVLKWTHPQSRVEVTRSYQLHADEYGVQVKLTLTNRGTEAVEYDLKALLSGVQNDEQASGSMFSPPIYAFETVCRHAEDFERIPASNLAESIEDADEKTTFGEVSWAGVDNRYFITAALADAEEIEDCAFFEGPAAAGVKPADVPKDFTLVTTQLNLTGGTLAPGSTV